MGELEEARRQIDALPNVLREDFRLKLKFQTNLQEAKCVIFPEIINLIEEAFEHPDSPLKVCSLQFRLNGCRVIPRIRGFPP